MYPTLNRLCPTNGATLATPLNGAVYVFQFTGVALIRCVIEYGMNEAGKLTNTLNLRKIGTTISEMQKEFSEDHPAYALFRVVSNIIK